MQGSRDRLGVQTAFYTGPKNSCKAVWEVVFSLGLGQLSQNKKCQPWARSPSCSLLRPWSVFPSLCSSTG